MVTDTSEKIIKISYFTIIFKHNFGYAMFMSLNEAPSMLFTPKLVEVLLLDLKFYQLEHQ